MFGIASESGDALRSNIATAYGRVTDFALAAPNTTMLRLSASTVQQRDALFFRGDVGLDLIDRSGTATPTLTSTGV